MDYDTKMMMECDDEDSHVGEELLLNLLHSRDHLFSKSMPIHVTNPININSNGHGSHHHHHHHHHHHNNIVNTTPKKNVNIKKSPVTGTTTVGGKTQIFDHQPIYQYNGTHSSQSLPNFNQLESKSNYKQKQQQQQSYLYHQQSPNTTAQPPNSLSSGNEFMKSYIPSHPFQQHSTTNNVNPLNSSSSSISSVIDVMMDDNNINNNNNNNIDNEPTSDDSVLQFQEGSSPMINPMTEYIMSSPSANKTSYMKSPALILEEIPQPSPHQILPQQHIQIQPPHQQSPIPQLCTFKQQCMLCKRGKPNLLNRSPTWAAIMKVVFYTLSHSIPEKTYFSLKSDVYSFMNAHWELLSLNKKKSTNWHKQIQDMLSHSKTLFESGAEIVGQNGYWKLRYNVDPWIEEGGSTPTTSQQPLTPKSASSFISNSPMGSNFVPSSPSSYKESSYLSVSPPATTITASTSPFANSSASSITNRIIRSKSYDAPLPSFVNNIQTSGQMGSSLIPTPPSSSSLMIPKSVNNQNQNQNIKVNGNQLPPLLFPNGSPPTTSNTQSNSTNSTPRIPFSTLNINEQQIPTPRSFNDLSNILE